MNLTARWFSLVLREGPLLDDAIRNPSAPDEPARQLLILSLLGLVAHGVAVGLVATHVDLGAAFHFGWLLDVAPILWLPVSLVVVFTGALAICLPSFYFYTQLSGLDVSFRLITAQALRVQARTSVLLLGVLPFYVAAGLAPVLGVGVSPDQVLGIGLGLPFFLGILGLDSLRHSFERLAAILPNTRGDGSAFVRYAVVAWGAVFVSVAPIGLFRILHAIGGADAPVGVSVLLRTLTGAA